MLYGSIDVEYFVIVVEVTSPLDAAAVRSWMSSCRAVGSMATATVAAVMGLFDWYIFDEVFK